MWYCKFVLGRIHYVIPAKLRARCGTSHLVYNIPWEQAVSFAAGPNSGNFEPFEIETNGNSKKSYYRKCILLILDSIIPLHTRASMHVFASFHFRQPQRAGWTHLQNSAMNSYFRRRPCGCGTFRPWRCKVPRNSTPFSSCLSSRGLGHGETEHVLLTNKKTGSLTCK